LTNIFVQVAHRSPGKSGTLLKSWDNATTESAKILANIDQWCGDVSKARAPSRSSELLNEIRTSCRGKISRRTAWPPRRDGGFCESGRDLAA
jgi:hypothetical protein